MLKVGASPPALSKGSMAYARGVQNRMATLIQCYWRGHLTRLLAQDIELFMLSTGSSRFYCKSLGHPATELVVVMPMAESSAIRFWEWKFKASMGRSVVHCRAVRKKLADRASPLSTYIYFGSPHSWGLG